MTKKQHLFLIISISLLIPIIPFALIGELPGERWLSAADSNAWLFGSSGIGLLALDLLLPIPSSIIGTLLGARLGFAAGFLCTWLGLMIGNMIGYLLGHLWPEKMAEQLPQAPSMIVLFLSRPVPVFAEAATVTAGANRLSFKRFFLSCALGNALYALVLAGNGAYQLPEGLVGPGLVIPMALPIAAWMLWRWIDSKRADKALLESTKLD